MGRDESEPRSTELAALPIIGVHRVVQGANAPNSGVESADARMTTDSIRQVLDAARTGQPLGPDENPD